MESEASQLRTPANADCRMIAAAEGYADRLRAARVARTANTPAGSGGRALPAPEHGLSAAELRERALERQRAEARELERMRGYDRVALPTAPPRSSAGSSMHLPQRPARPEPAGEQGASAEVGQSQHVGATATPCGRGRQTTPEVRGHMAAPVFCQPRGQSMPGAHCPPAAPALCQPAGLPYMAPYCPLTLPLQCIHPPAEEGPIGAAWQSPSYRHEPVVARTGAEPLTNPMTGLGRLTRDQPNWRAPASTRATSAADVSASFRPLHSIRPKSSSSTPSSTDSEAAIADLRVRRTIRSSIPRRSPGAVPGQWTNNVCLDARFLFYIWTAT